MIARPFNALLTVKAKVVKKYQLKAGVLEQLPSVTEEDSTYVRIIKVEG
jgi:hypothetical protein